MLYRGAIKLDLIHHICLNVKKELPLNMTNVIESFRWDSFGKVTGIFFQGL